MLRLFAATAVFVMIWAGAGATAQERPVVIELFTSQGCSSCPPADAMLGELADRDDVIALALHVDYWDYIGWKDEMADPAYTERQRGYARAAGHRSIYTPQFIIGGRDHVIGFKPMEVARLIEEHGDAPRRVDLSVTRTGDRIRIDARQIGASAGPLVVKVVRYTPRESVSIRRGENAGRTIEYRNIVDLLAEIGRWNGQGTYSVTARVTGDKPVAVLLQRPDQGPIVAAAHAR